MRDEDDATDGPPDPQLHPEQSPGFGTDLADLSDIDVGRDVTIGEASPEELMASDTDPAADHSVETLLETLVDGNAIERRRAALRLAEVCPDDDRVAEVIAGVAGSDDDEDVRQFAVEALGKLGGEIAERGALAVSNDDDPWVRAEAIVTLDRLDRASYVERMERALEDDHHAVRRNALVSLFKYGGEDAAPELLEATDDPSERVREWAAHMLGGVDSQTARETLVDVAENDDSDIVRITALNALDSDPDRFRRSFRDALERDVTLPGEDLLNRVPRL